MLLIDISMITEIAYYNATFDHLNINLIVRAGIISLGKLNSKQVRHLLTMLLFEVQNNLIRTRITTKCRLRPSN